jgi:hypothetical protein
MSGYRSFLESKRVSAPEAGFRVEREALNPKLFGFQKTLVRWALERGRAALFCETGLGKTPMQLEWARRVSDGTGGDVLILAPLAVAHQTAREGRKFGIGVTVCREAADLRPGINVTNYDRLDRFDPAAFVGVVLDESSALKGFGSKLRWALNEAFAETPYKLCCTATPAPNQHSEIGTHAHFLGVMDHGEMLTRWFINDTTEARALRLKKHGEKDFWRWVATWAACVMRPSDLRDERGRPYPDNGFELPPLTVREHRVVVDHRATQEETGKLFRAATPMAATELHAELRRTAPERASRAAEIVRQEPEESWAVWCNTNREADALMALLKPLGAVEVRGNDKPEAKEERLLAFGEGEVPILVSKPSIAGFGMNFQSCARHAFVGLSFSFEQFYQALRRSYRFGQTREVEAHVITAETEQQVRQTIHRKQEEHARMQRKLVEATRENSKSGVGRAEIGAAAVRTESGEGWTLSQGDCVEVLNGDVPDDSIHLSVFSPPFSSLYSYSPSLRDMGNCANDEEFFEHFSHLIPELLRATVPGRLCVVHTKDLVRYKNRYGYGGLRDFTGEVTRAFEDCVQPDGTRWAYHSKVTIWTDPVREMQKTKSMGLLYKTLKKDASYCRVGNPEYLVVFRKWTPEADSPEPVEHRPGTEQEIPLEIWQRYASPVWMDIRRTDVLNAKVARENEDEKHLAPLQLEVIRRCVELWSNPGDLVFDPFAGLCSTGYEALGMGRRFSGVELKEAYWKQGVKFLKAREGGSEQETLPFEALLG